MATIRVAVNFGIGKSCKPFPEKMLVEYEIAIAPADEHRNGFQQFQPVLHAGNQIETPVARLQRDILHESMHGDAVCPGVIRGTVGIGNLGGHRLAGHTRFDRTPTECIKTPDKNGSERTAGQLELPRDRFRGGQMKRTRVQHHEPPNPFRVLCGEGHADHPPPVVNDESQIGFRAAPVEPGFQIGHSPRQ